MVVIISFADGRRRHSSSHVKSGKPKDRGNHVEFAEQMVVDISIGEEGPEELQLKKFNRNDRSRLFVAGSKDNAKRKNVLQDEVRLIDKVGVFHVNQTSMCFDPHLN